MKKFAILAGLMTLALFIGVAGTALRTDKAEARPTDVISFNPDVCSAVVVGDLIENGISSGDDAITVDAAVGAAATVCYLPGIVVPANLNSLAEILDGASIDEAFDADLEGAVDDPDTYSVLVDYSAAQLGAEGTPLPGGQAMWVLVFVTNDENVTLDADEGVWYSTSPAPYSSQAGPCPFADFDCDNAIPTAGDGVVVDLLFGDASNADLGDAIITATQAGVDAELEYEVVGAPDDLALVATKATIQEDAADEDCDLAAFTTAIAKPQIAGLLAAVTDDDGTALTGIPVGWETDDDDNVHLALVQNGDDKGDPTFQTVTLSSSGQASAPNLGCAGDTGKATITATVLVYEPADGEEAGFVETNIDDDVDITVVGAPASMTLAANPPAVACNGTNSSEVSATILDSDGKPVLAGNAVHFEVVALGQADPINAKTDAKGVAASKITPLSGVTAGVTVIVTVPGTDLEQNVLVACTPGPGTVPGPVVTPVTPPVTPPRTGDGGYLP